MNLSWIKDEEVRDRVALDVLLCGNGYVVEEDDGTEQMRIAPERMNVILDKKTRKPTAYITELFGQKIRFEPEHVWHGKLAVEGG